MRSPALVGLLWTLAACASLSMSGSRAEEPAPEKPANAWTWVGWGGGGYYWSCAFHPGKNGTIYLGGDVGGFYKSEDHGAHWKISNECLASYGVFCLATDKQNPDTLYAGTPKGICKSLDAGERWTLLEKTSTGPAAMVFNKGGSVRAIAVDTKNSSVVYAGSVSGKIFVSKDGGATWEISYTPAEKCVVAALAVSETEPPVVFAATSLGVLKSEDGGATWKALPSPKHAASIACAPKTAQVLYGAFGKDGVRKSEDGGATWTPCGEGIKEGCAIREVAVSAQDAQRVYCVGNVNWDGYFYASEDGGKTWRANRSIKKEPAGDPTLPEDGGGPDAFVPLSATKNLAVNPLDANEVYVAANWRNVHSTDGGKTFSERNLGCDITCITDIRFDAKHVYVSAMDEGSFRGDRKGGWEALWPRKYDGESSGHHWRIGLGDFQDGAARRILLTNSPWNLNPPRNQALLIEAGGARGIVRAGLPDYLPRVNCMWGQSYPRALAADPKNPDTIYLGMDGDPEPEKKLPGGGVFKSADGGKTWARLAEQPGSRRVFNGLVFEPGEPGRLFWGACGKDGGVYRSENEGAWKLVFKDETWIFNVELLPDGGGVLAAGKNLWKSTDYGETWTKLTDFDGMQIVGIAAGAGRLWVSRVTWGEDAVGAVMESADGGKTWTEITAGLPYKKPLVLRYDPYEKALWAGGVGLYKRAVPEK
ncbi:MAG: hypothetical protein KIS92_17610 [Planctomycetota bacterium]|nr:hypothetical protein [Planctomycetota bacterium]